MQAGAAQRRYDRIGLGGKRSEGRQCRWQVGLVREKRWRDEWSVDSA